MGSDRWTQKLELGLVKLYKKFRCLWMIGLPTYNDLDRRYAAYVKIVETLRPELGSLTVPRVVYKIRDLRYRYCLELTKIERAAARGRYYTPKVPWFRVMHSFLDPRFRTDEFKDFQATNRSETKLGRDYSGTRLTPSTCKIIYENHLKMKKSASTVEELEESVNDSGNYADFDLKRRSRGAEESGEVKEIQDDDLLKNKTRLRKGYSEIRTWKTARTRTSLESKKEIARDEFDEFNAFGMSIGSQMKTLNSELVRELAVEIFGILKEERTRGLQQPVKHYKIIR